MVGKPCEFDRADDTCSVHGGGRGPCLVRMGEAMHEQREREQREHADHCVYVAGTLYWKAEALLQALGQGRERDRLLIAAAVPIPVPIEVARERMAEAQAAWAVWAKTEKERAT